MKGFANSTRDAAVITAYEALLLSDVTHRDADGLGHGTYESIGIFLNIVDARSAAEQEQEARGAVGYMTRAVSSARLTAKGNPSVAMRFIPFEVDGDYMSPTLQPGDVVEIDATVTAIPRTGMPNESEGIYLLAFPSGLPALRRIRRSFEREGSWWYVTCDKTAGLPECREEVQERELRIIGRATRVLNVRKI